jgi:hypothetical protein
LARQFLTGDEQAAVRQPVDRPSQPWPTLRDDLAVAVEIDRDDLARSPVSKPEALLVPARWLADRELAQQNVRFGHRWLP